MGDRISHAGSRLKRLRSMVLSKNQYKFEKEQKAIMQDKIKKKEKHFSGDR